MNRLQLFLLLRHNNKLDTRRSPIFEQSMVAKVMMLFGAAMMAFFLIVYGVMFSVIANKEDMPSFILVIMPFLLLCDFGLRFMIQQTPLMQAQPYFLLPIPRRSVIDSFLLSSLLRGWNWVWLSLFIPYLVITVAGGTPFVTALLVLLNGMLLVLANSQWYLLIRTLVGRSLLWWCLPAGVNGGYFALLFLSEDYKAIEHLFDAIGEEGGSPLVMLFCAALLSGLFALNRSLQYRFVYEEVSHAQKAPQTIKTVSEFSFLERFGLVGEYLKLELKSILRNKAIRSRVLMSLGLVVMLSALITFTDMYDGFMMLNFWCYYCFAIYGMTALVKVMGPEGNYIDLLMVHQRNIFLLLRAKYYFHCAILVVPFLVMLPAVINGKFSWLMMLAYFFLSSGMLYFILFQLAVYNKQTLPLDQKLTGKGNMENGLQLILEMVGMFTPILIVAFLLIAFDETTAYTVMIVLGALLTLLHPLWLQNIYRRMMARKYDNLDGFKSSRG